MIRKLERALVPGLLLAAIYYAVFGGEYSIFELQGARESLQEERQALVRVHAEIDSLAASADSLANDGATIERIAREEFGMIREGETLYRFVDGDQVVGERETEADER